MKAAVLHGVGKMSVEQVADPQVVDNSLLIKVIACGVCGSDLRILDSGNNRVSYPAIMGHEVAGEIVQVGRGITGFNEGDKVAIGADIPCGHCDWCRNDMGNCCDENYALGYQLAGGFAEYCLLPPRVVQLGPVVRLPNEMNTEHAVVAEPLACCINGYERVYFASGKSVLIIGAGPIGVMLTMLARVFGAGQTILCDIDQSRLDASRFAQADYYVNSSKEQLRNVVMELTKGRGADVTFTACASHDAQEDAAALVAKRGFVNFFGGLPTNARLIQISSNILHYREAYLTGSHGSTPRQHHKAVELVASGRLSIDRLITHRMPLDRIDEAFKAARSHQAMKVLVTPGLLGTSTSNRVMRNSRIS